MVMATNSCNATFEHWWDPEGRKHQIVRRRNWRASMKIYLEKTPLISGVSKGYESIFPDAKALADVYAKLMEAELAHHDSNPEHALWTGLMFGPLFANLWTLTTSIKVSSLAIPDGINSFRGLPRKHKLDVAFLKNFADALPVYIIEDWIAGETFETAEMLAQCFVKSFAELSHVCSKSEEEPIVIRHHAAQVALWLTEMQSLVLQGGEQTDLRLPDDHAHKISAMRQREVRQQFGDEMFNVALRPV